MRSSVMVAVRVSATPLRTFNVFTRDIGVWWQPAGLFALTNQGDGTLSFQGTQNGRLISESKDGRVVEIGRITAWEPGKRLAFTWRPTSFEPGQSTDVEVRFDDVDGQTRVTVQHWGWAELPREHAARHGFPDSATLARASEWWRDELHALRRRVNDNAAR